MENDYLLTIKACIFALWSWDQTELFRLSLVLDQTCRLSWRLFWSFG